MLPNRATHRNSLNSDVDTKPEWSWPWKEKSISPYSENVDRNNSEYGNLLRSEVILKITWDWFFEKKIQPIFYA